MQFITGGPDVPERLIQAHEEGRVVFFCGAGISYPAGLPGFRGLVDRLYTEVGDSPNALERTAQKARQYDTAIGLLEARLAPNGQGRERVRRAASLILTPTTVSPKTTSTHAALLTLARSRDSRTRLVTTNFDRLFDEVIVRDGVKVAQFHAPLLPVPKNRWDGLVYLHGLLTSAPSSSDLDRLVLSSGDFGLAYLTERWAARFVSELFRNYTVCFVGYSINDPVLRYMMDALAADRLLGESSPEMFAFGSHAKGKEHQQKDEWCAKNVTPILYPEYRRHAYLHRTLSAWAATYRDGVGGKEQIVVQHAHLQPQNSTREEDFVGRVLWALSDGSGLPARRFANAVPAPSFDWVESFVERRFGHDDLARFGVAPLPLLEEKRLLSQFRGGTALEFSLLERPAPYLRAPYMTLVHWGSREGQPDEVMRHLAHWLLRYLDEPKLILWLAKHGGSLSDLLASVIEHRLDQIGEWEQKGDTGQLDTLRRDSPQAIPRLLLRPLWRLFLTGHVRTTASSFGLYQWFDRMRRDGLTGSLRRSFRELLAPRIVLREPFHWGNEESEDTTPERLKTLVEWDLVLACDHVHSALRDKGGGSWQATLPALLDDATSLLREAFDLMAELGAANAESDLSYVHQPSIAEHPQNREFNDWTALIDLARDAWLATSTINIVRARAVAEQWWVVDYPIFRRLAFFAAAQDEVVPAEHALAWLLADDGWWMWSVETEREAMRLLVTLGPRLEQIALVSLEAAILAGPPRRMFKEDLEGERWTRIVDREVWLRLAKLQAAESILGEEARVRLAELSARFPDWRLEDDGREEFPFWMGDGDEGRAIEPTPKLRRELTQWLREHPEEDHWNPDDWAERCRKDFPTTACALWSLAKEGFWPTSRWERALQAWSDDSLRKKSWRYLAPVVLTAPDDAIASLAHGLSWWLEKVAKVFDRHQRTFFSLIERVLARDYQDENELDDPVMRAINHPVGHVTEALLDWWSRHELQNDQGLPPEVEPFFSRLCEDHQAKFRHGRVLLAAHVINLFLVDRDWTTQRLLPHFNWGRSAVEARGAWEGFLWSPRLVRAHLAAIKPDLLETARHYNELGKHGRQYAAFLTYAALDRADTFTIEELREAFHSLPPEGLAEAARALARGLEGAGEKRESYWTHRIAPFWKNIWPKLNTASPAIADDLFRLCIAAGPNFPEVLDTVRPWLTPIPHPGYLINLLQESGLCERSPEAALEWLNLLIDAQPWAPRELPGCLQAVSRASPNLLHDARYRRLNEYCRIHAL